ncbi:MAG: hypothetical protein Q8909_02870 [Bacteroidota bacterium]|nr:hypothetical protein [Bacteroidota bacterium]
MKINDNHIDKLFSQKLTNLETDLPDSCWNAIEQALPKRKSRPIIPLWGRVAVAAVGLFLVGTIGYLTFIGKTPNQTASVISDKSKTAIFHNAAENIIFAANNAVQKQDKKTGKQDFTANHQAVAVTKKHRANTKFNIAKEEFTDNNATNTPTVRDNSNVAENGNPEAAATKVATQSEIDDFANAGNELASNADQNTSGLHSSLGLQLALTGPEGSQSKSEFSSLRTTAKMDQLMSIISDNQTSTETSNTTVVHDLPISLGISLENEISNKFALQTGITGTYLRSTQTSNTSLYFTDEIQELYYLGLPLSIAYRFAENERFSFYIKTGGMVEKNIGGRWRDRVQKDGNVVYTKVQHDLENKLQWSTYIGGGANYKLSQRMRLYLEPALSYYFDNNSNIDNIHKQQRLDVTLQAGLRAVFDSH